MRVVTFVVSTFGSLGAQAQDLIKDIGRRTNLFVPFSLTHETSWATSSITTFLRSALTFQVRKRVAVILREHLPDDFLPPPPIPTSLPLSESDQGNLVGNLPSKGWCPLVCLRVLCLWFVPRLIFIYYPLPGIFFCLKRAVFGIWVHSDPQNGCRYLQCTGTPRLHKQIELSEGEVGQRLGACSLIP